MGSHYCLSFLVLFIHLQIWGVKYSLLFQYILYFGNISVRLSKTNHFDKKISSITTSPTYCTIGFCILLNVYSLTSGHLPILRMRKENWSDEWNSYLSIILHGRKYLPKETSNLIILVCAQNIIFWTKNTKENHK